MPCVLGTEMAMATHIKKRKGVLVRVQLGRLKMLAMIDIGKNVAQIRIGARMQNCAFGYPLYGMARECNNTPLPPDGDSRLVGGIIKETSIPGDMLRERFTMQLKATEGFGTRNLKIIPREPCIILVVSEQGEELFPKQVEQAMHEHEEPLLTVRR